MEDLCFGCGEYPDGNEPQYPECGMLTKKAIRQGYYPQNDGRKQHGIFCNVMDTPMTVTAISPMVIR